jgi:hypothetical protein
MEHFVLNIIHAIMSAKCYSTFQRRDLELHIARFVCMDPEEGSTWDWMRWACVFLYSKWEYVLVSVSHGTADVVDVVYANIVTWSVGWVGLGEAAKGEQSIANQGQEWMCIRATIKKAGSPSK